MLSNERLQAALASLERGDLFDMNHDQELNDALNLVRALITPETLVEIEAEIGEQWRGCYSFDSGGDYEVVAHAYNDVEQAARACLLVKRWEELT